MSGTVDGIDLLIMIVIGAACIGAAIWGMEKREKTNDNDPT